MRGGEVKDPIKVANIMGGAQSWLGFFEKGTSGQGGGAVVWGPISPKSLGSYLAQWGPGRELSLNWS